MVIDQWPAAAGEGLTTDTLRRGAYPAHLSIAAANFTNRFSEALGTELEAWRRPTMADTIQRVEYFYLQVPNKAGEGARFLTALDAAA